MRSDHVHGLAISPLELPVHILQRVPMLNLAPALVDPTPHSRVESKLCRVREPLYIPYLHSDQRG